MKLSPDGMDRDALFQTLAAYRGRDLDWRQGKAYAYVYDAGRDVEEVGREAFGEFLFENALDPTQFPSLLRLENEVVAIAADHLRGDADVAGAFTSGGTESIMLAVKAARDHARAHRPEVTAPEMVLPTTGHAAFHKAAEYLGLKVVLADVDPETFRADVDAVRDAISADTILLVGSAPSYAHGVIDPIPELGALAEERGLWLHVDACVGGWLLPYYRRLGEPVADFDFAVPGVTSISMDLHKYAFVPKGASLVLYRTKELRRFQLFACTEWTGYSVINPTVQSSRSGGPLAAAWAVLQRVGDAGYLELARRLVAGTKALIAGIEATPGLRVLGAPDFCMVAAAADDDELSVFHLIDELNGAGWYVQAQFGFRGAPPSVHFSLSPKNADRVDELVAAIGGAVQVARTLPAGQLAGAVQGFLGDLTPEQVAEQFETLLGFAGIEGSALPERMAGVHELLDALPRDLLKAVLIQFVGELYQPAREPALQEA